MGFKLNSFVSVWRSASLGHLNLNRGRQLEYLLLGNGGGVKKVISSSSYSWSPLLSRGITINSCCYCNSNNSKVEEDQIKPRHNPPLLSSMAAPCLLIPSPKDKEEHEVIAAAIAKEVGKGTGEEEFGFPDYCFYSLADKKLVSLNNVRRKSKIVIPDHAFCVGSSHGWLAYMDPREPALFLTNPLVSPVPLTIRLPPLKTVACTINPSLSGICKPYFINHIVMSSAPSSDNDKDCTVMVSVGLFSDLSFCKIGDSSWTDLETSLGFGSRCELTYSSKDQLFYCRENKLYGSNIESWDLRNPCSPRRILINSPWAYGLPDYPDSEMEIRRGYRGGRYYLVVDSHSGDVLLVNKRVTIFPLAKIRTDVYRLNAPKKGWDYVTDLGDGVLFVGLNHAFHLSATDFAPGVLIPNSVYFTRHHDANEDTEMGIYNIQDFTFKSLFPSHLHPFNKIHKPPPVWFTPNPSNN